MENNEKSEFFSVDSNGLIIVTDTAGIMFVVIGWDIKGESLCPYGYELTTSSIRKN